MSNQTQAASSGLGCWTILGLIFVTLKLTGTGVVATWPWWQVLMPFWAPFLIAIVIILVLMVIAVAAGK